MVYCILLHRQLCWALWMLASSMCVQIQQVNLPELSFHTNIMYSIKASSGIKTPAFFWETHIKVRFVIHRHIHHFSLKKVEIFYRSRTSRSFFVHNVWTMKWLFKGHYDTEQGFYFQKVYGNFWQIHKWCSYLISTYMQKRYYTKWKICIAGFPICGAFCLLCYTREIEHWHRVTRASTSLTLCISKSVFPLSNLICVIIPHIKYTPR